MSRGLSGNGQRQSVSTLVEDVRGRLHMLTVTEIRCNGVSKERKSRADLKGPQLGLIRQTEPD